MQGEPWFTDDDTSMLLDWFDYKDSLCPRCGHPRSLGFDPEHEWHWKAYVYACHPCAAEDRALRQVDVKDGAYAVVEYTGPEIMA